MIQISDEYIDKLIELFENIRDNQWAVGDTLVLLVDSNPDDRQDIMNYIAGKLAVSASTLYDYENTARRWSPDKRREYASLDWTIYRNSDPERDKELLDQAIDENWNATTFKEKMFPALLDPAALIGKAIRMLEKILEQEIEPATSEGVKQVLKDLAAILTQLDEF
jgi:hypothetical protein